MITTTENKKSELPVDNFDPNNQCFHCRRGKERVFDTRTHRPVGLYLMNDKNGFMTCNLCVESGVGIRTIKMSKKEKKQQKKMRLQMEKMLGIPHVTLDSKGNIV